MIPTFALAIPHAKHLPERREQFAKLTWDLVRGAGSLAVPPRVEFFDEKMSCFEWSSAMWEWGTWQPTTHFLQVQDDVEVSPHFWPAVHSLAYDYPDQIIGLQSHHPAAPRIYAEGHRMYTTADGLVGVGYMMPTDVLSDFRFWLAGDLKPGQQEQLTEDTLINLFAISTGRKIYHPLPSPISHITGMPSTWGADHHEMRETTCSWQTHDPGDWTDWRVHCLNEGIPHLGRVYEGTHRVLLEVSKTFTREDSQRVHDDRCPPRWKATPGLKCPHCDGALLGYAPGATNMAVYK